MYMEITVQKLDNVPSVTELVNDTAKILIQALS